MNYYQGIILPLLCLFFFLFLLSCGTSLSPERYVKWARSSESGLSQVISVGDYIYKASYEPLPLVALKRKGKGIDKNSLELFLEDNANTHFFILEISVKEGGDLIEYQAISQAEVQRKIHYFSYRLQSEISFKMGGQAFPCDIYHFERSFDLKPSRTFVIGFNNSKTKQPESTISLIIDSILLTEKPIELDFEIADLPQLSI